MFEFMLLFELLFIVFVLEFMLLFMLPLPRRPRRPRLRPPVEGAAISVEAAGDALSSLEAAGMLESAGVASVVGGVIV
ncbi:MAG: hypothetical protein WCD76_01705, partial [Pyrinomonadaceae bacterium]